MSTHEQHISNLCVPLATHVYRLEHVRERVSVGGRSRGWLEAGGEGLEQGKHLPLLRIAGADGAGMCVVMRAVERLVVRGSVMTWTP